MYTLILTEKKDLAFPDSEVFHLHRDTVTLAPPEAYGYLPDDEYSIEENKVQAFQELPILPETLKLRVGDAYKDDIEAVKELAAGAEKVVVLSTEKEFLLAARLTVLRAGIKKPVYYSADGTDLLRYEDDDPGVMALFNHKKADWYFGATINRLLSLKLNEPIQLSILSAVLLSKVAAGGCTKDSLLDALPGVQNSTVNAAVMSLFDQKLVAYKKGRFGGGQIELTDTGRQVMGMLPDGAFDMGILKVSENLSTFRAYIEGLHSYIKDIPTGITFDGDRPVYATCPWCGGPVIRATTGTAAHFLCGNKNCGYDVATDAPEVLVRTGNPFTERQCLQLVRDGKIVIPCRKKAGKDTYNTIFRVGRVTGDEGNYAVIKSSLERS